MANRVKVFQTANTSLNFETLPPNLDQLVDIDSTQTVSNKTFVGGSFASLQAQVNGIMKCILMGALGPGGAVGVCPSLVQYLPAAYSQF